MLPPQWHDCLQAELRKRGLPPGYSARLAEELADHLIDLQKEQESMDAHTSVAEKLGDPQVLAAVAGREYRRRTFAGRHPIVTFILGPIPTVLLTFLVPLFLCIGCCWLIGAARGSVLGTPKTTPIYGEPVLAFAMTYLLRLTPFILSAALFFRLAQRAGKPGWGIFACVLVGCIAAIFRVLMVPATGAAPGSLTIGFDIGDQLDFWWQKGIQSIVPFGLALWMGWQMWSRSGSDRRTMGPAAEPVA